MIDLLALAVAIPLLGALTTAALRTWSTRLGLASAIATAAAVIVLVSHVALRGIMRSDIGGWGAPLGIALQADGLSAALLAMANLVALATSVYAAGYFRSEATQQDFWPLWLLLWGALNALFLAADLFNIYVTLELLGLAAVALAALGGERAAVAAALRYLMVSLLGSMTYLLGVALIYAAYGTLDLGLAAESVSATPAAATAFALMAVGLLLKAALFPLHFWLPPAHASAPAPVSAALSALVVKAAYYLVLRLWLDLFEPVTTSASANLLGALGAGAVLWGSWHALRAHRLKLVAAYSTVGQIGYLFLFFPLASVDPSGSTRQSLIGAAVLLALTHGFAKAALFLAAGQVQRRTGHDRLENLSGMAQTQPAATFTIALAGVALIGLPPSGAFIGKWIMLGEAFASGQWWLILVMVGGTLLTGAYMFRILSKTFLRGATGHSVGPRGISDLPPLVLGLFATAILGIFPAPFWRLLSAGV
jgi:multicomponent Na+:H+ antiporter subunit D